MRGIKRVVLCGVLLGLLLCGTAWAVQPEQKVSVRLNGVSVELREEIKLIDGRAYLPFRAVFRTLGFADDRITFEGESQTLRAEGEAFSVSMVVGEQIMRVTREEKTKILHLDTPAFIDPVLGRAYVPARFIGEAAGYRVGWNEESRTVLLEDTEVILRDNKESYDRLEDYLSFCLSRQSWNLRTEGNYTAHLVMGEEQLFMEGDYTMLRDQSGLFELEMPVDVTGTAAGVPVGGLLPEGLCLRVQGSQRGKIHHIQIGTGESMEQEWVPFDVTVLEEDYPAVAADFLRWLYPERARLTGGTGREYIEELVREKAAAEPSVSAADILAELNALFADRSFRMEQGSWVNEWEDKTGNMSFSLLMEQDQVVGYEIQFTRAVMDQEAGMELYSQVRENEMELRLTLAEGADQYVSIYMDGSFAQTNRRPAGYLP